MLRQHVMMFDPLGPAGDINAAGGEPLLRIFEALVEPTKTGKHQWRATFEKTGMRSIVIDLEHEAIGPIIARVHRGNQFAAHSKIIAP